MTHSQPEKFQNDPLRPTTIPKILTVTYFDPITPKKFPQWSTKSFNKSFKQLLNNPKQPKKDLAATHYNLKKLYHTPAMSKLHNDHYNPLLPKKFQSDPLPKQYPTTILNSSTMTHYHPQSCPKYFEKNWEVRQTYIKPRNFYLCFCIVFERQCQKKYFCRED